MFMTYTIKTNLTVVSTTNNIREAMEIAESHAFHKGVRTFVHGACGPIRHFDQRG